MRTRREFIAGTVSAAAVSGAAAQQSAKRPRLAIVSPSEPIAQMHEDGDNRYYRVLFEELRRRGHVEGQNLTVERYAREQSTDGPAAMVAQEVRSNPDVVVELIEQARLPAMYSFREFVEVGGLPAYTFDLVGLNRRVAADIDADLHGANPGDIPYFQSTMFELFINLKTAKALGLTVPPILFAFATEVVE